MAYIDTIPNHASDVYSFPISAVRQLRDGRPDAYMAVRELRKYQAFDPMRVEGNMVHIFGSKNFHDDAGIIKYMLRDDWVYQWSLNMDTMRLEETVLRKDPTLFDILILKLPEHLVQASCLEKRTRAKEDRFSRMLRQRAARRYRWKNYQDNLKDGFVDEWAADLVEAKSLEDAMGKPSVLLQFPFSLD